MDPSRDHVLIGRERNDVGRPGDLGYPIRTIIKGGLLYSHNFEASRWPTCNPETGYLDCDSSPTKTSILEAHRKNSEDPFWALCFGKRVEDELYDLKNDPDCVRNLASNPDNASLQRSLGAQLVAELQSQGDPRALGRGREFDSCPFASDKHAGLYERFMKGQMKLPGFKESDIDSVQTAVNVDSK